MAESSRVDKTMKALRDALEKQYRDTASIRHEGDTIILPKTMTNAEAARRIMEFDKMQEEEIQSRADFECNPYDGLACFYRAMSEQFGTLMGMSSGDGFKEKIPGRMLTINISATEQLSVPIGDTSVPGLPIKMSVSPIINDSNDLGGGLVVIFTFKRMYEPLIMDIIGKTREKIKNESIYMGRAIDSKFGFINLENFDPDRVIYSEKTERTIKAQVLQPIQNTKKWRESGSPLKRGILLHGPYGTGKTLTARLVANECQKNKWTFINVLPGDDIARSLRVAKRFPPAVVFFEDIDQATGGERDEDLNEILNTVDGIVGKNDEVMVILTTNHSNKINPGMLRPGRLDSTISCGDLDAYAIERLIRMTAKDKYGTTKLRGGLKMDEVMKAADGYTAAFISEAVVKAKAYALLDAKDDNWEITSDHVIAALEELRPQYVMMSTNHYKRPRDLETAMARLVGTTVKHVYDGHSAEDAINMTISQDENSEEEE